MLDTKDVFLMDNEAEIFVWVGKGATTDERKRGMGLAQQYCAQSGRPKSVRVGCVPCCMRRKSSGERQFPSSSPPIK